jgi:hypothetical protein
MWTGSTLVPQPQLVFVEPSLPLFPDRQTIGLDEPGSDAK